MIVEIPPVPLDTLTPGHLINYQTRLRPVNVSVFYGSIMPIMADGRLRNV